MERAPKPPCHCHPHTWKAALHSQLAGCSAAHLEELDASTARNYPSRHHAGSAGQLLAIRAASRLKSRHQPPPPLGLPPAHFHFSPPPPCPDRPYCRLVLLEHLQAVLPMLRCSTNCRGPRVGGTCSLGTVKVLHGRFTTPRARNKAHRIGPLVIS